MTVKLIGRPFADHPSGHAGAVRIPGRPWIVHEVREVGFAMAKLASEVLVERLAAWGVDTVFGLPGDGINGIMEGLRRHKDDVHMVLVHHEEAAAFMATGYAKATGRLGVCLATSGPGAHPPAQRALRREAGPRPGARDHRHAGDHACSASAYQQEVHLEQLYADVAEYNLLITNPQQLPQALVDIAIRTALCPPRRRAPQPAPTTSRSPRPPRTRTSTPRPASRTPTAPIYVTRPDVRATRSCRPPPKSSTAASKIAILAGAGALHARDEVETVAEHARRAGRQDPAGQGRPAGRLALHHRRHRPAGHRARPADLMEESTRC